MTLRTVWRHSPSLLAVVLLAVQGCAGEGKDAPAPASAPETVVVISDNAPVKTGDQVVATVEKGRRFGVLSRRGDQVEIQVCVGTEIRRGSLDTSQVKFLTDADIDLAAEWLSIAKDLDPKIDLLAYRATLNALIERVAAAAAPGNTPREKARLIAVQLFQHEGFTYKPHVNRPDRLLDLKQGDCFGFSYLYLCIGQRLRMPLCLVTAPEHVLVRFEARGERFNIETTQQGKLLDTDDYLREGLGAQRFSQVGGTDLASLPVPRALGPLFCKWGLALGMMEKHADACEKFAKAIEINSRDAETYTNWGNALGRMDKHADACKRYAKAVEINPRLAEADYNWGVALVRMGKPADACEKYARVVEVHPRYANAYYDWGTALVNMGRPADACEKYAKAVEINPRLAGAYYNWGMALRALSRNAEAIEKLEKAVALDPSLMRRIDGLRRKLTGGK